MEWVEGEQFDDYIVESLGNPAKLGQLLTKFLAMMDELRQAGIAHGDLQHGNIIMCGNELRLVDYDGMFVPAMNGYLASELGHRNYQHPQRAAHHFGPYLDNFSAWVIYASVRACRSILACCTSSAAAMIVYCFARLTSLTHCIRPLFGSRESQRCRAQYGWALSSGPIREGSG